MSKHTNAMKYLLALLLCVTVMSAAAYAQEGEDSEAFTTWMIQVCALQMQLQCKNIGCQNQSDRDYFYSVYFMQNKTPFEAIQSVCELYDTPPKP